MKNIKVFLIIITSVFLMSSCNNGYRNAIDVADKSMAILPYETVFTGRLPENLSPEQIDQIEEAESQAFQVSLYNQIMRKLGNGKTSLKIQHVDETNGRLKKANISIRDSWKMPASELASILGVDLIVKAKIHKQQYLTDFESYGIYVARQVSSVLTGRVPWSLPSTKSADVLVNCSILEAYDGTAIWSKSVDHTTNWNRNTRDVIESINYRVSRKMKAKEID